MSLTQRAILLSAVLFVVCPGPAHGQVRLSPEEADRLVTEKPEPLYPAIARAAKAEGVVKVEAHVSEQGTVTSVRAVSGHPLLRAAAVGAVRRRKYKVHTVAGEPAPFVTEVSVRFPPGPAGGAHERDYGRQDELARQYFKEADRCRDLVRAEQWSEAEQSCGAVVRIADRLSDDRALEKMGASELFGHALRGQKRYREALAYYERAHAAVRSRLTEKDAELGRLYGDMAITHHLLRDLDKARELYRKAEKIFQTAHASIGGDDSDEGVDFIRQSYMRSLKQLLGYHLIAAEDAGAAAEAEEVKRLLKSLP